MIEKLNKRIKGMNNWLKGGIMGFVIGDVITVVLYRVFFSDMDTWLMLSLLLTFEAIIIIIGLLVYAAVPAVKKWGKFIDDDIRDVLNGRLTMAQFAVTGLVFMVGWFGYQSWVYDEWSAKWGWLPVWVWSLVVAGLVFWWIGTWYWYEDRSEEVSYLVYAILTAGVVLCIWTGTGAINRDRRAVELGAAPESTYYLQNGGVVSRIFYASSNNGGFRLPPCSGKGCGTLYAALFVILLATASSCIPHFWMLACFLILAVMLRLVLKELRRRQSEVIYDFDIQK